MKVLIVALLAPALAHSQYVVTTVAGGAPATSGLGGGIARDAAGNTYLCNNTIISRIGSDGKIATYAGTGLAGYSGDGGSALMAQFDGAYFCAADEAGNLIVADTYNMRIRRIDQSGTVTTIVGTGISGALGDGGTGPAAQIGSVSGLAIATNGNIYFSDSTYGIIRRRDVSGTVQLIAGSTAAITPGDGGPAIAASLSGPRDVAVDAAGNTYFVDGNTVRRVAANGIISTVAGSRSATNAVQDGQQATSGLLGINGFTADFAGNLYITDRTFIRRVEAQTGLISTVAGTTAIGALSQGPALGTSTPNVGFLYADVDGVLWFSSTSLRTLSKGIVTVIANPTFLPTLDGALAISASVSPESLAISASGDIYFGDGNTCAIRKVGSDGKLSTVPGTGNCNATPRISPVSIAVDSHGTVYSSDTLGSGASAVYAISTSGSISAVKGLLGGYLATLLSKTGFYGVRMEPSYN